MIDVQRLTPVVSPQESCGIQFGGGAHLSQFWPKNSQGEDLTLLLTIDNDQLNRAMPYVNLPAGQFTSVFSTYRPERYFLDDIMYTGDEAELEYVKSGYTKVTMTRESALTPPPGEGLASVNVGVKKQSISEDDFPAFSFISQQLPHGMMGYDLLKDDYRFICQIYSADLPAEDGDALYLSDAIGYLFIRKTITDPADAGLFFVQTA